MAPAIKIENLSKYYKLGVINHGTLKKDFQSYAARLFKRQDPNAKIGHEQVYDKDGFWALSDINLEIEQGDCLAIFGINGAGKSTLLKILSRITAPTEGSFHMKGRVASLLDVGTGFHPELSGRDNIFMNGAILGMKRREVAQKIDDIIDFSEIDHHHIDTPVKRYSSGMYVRLGFSVAAHLDSEIIISDEVLAVGDLGYREKAIAKMKELSKQQGRTVLIVTHFPQMVMDLCDKGIILEKGKLTMGKSPINDIVNKYKSITGGNIS